MSEPLYYVNEGLRGMFWTMFGIYGTSELFIARLRAKGADRTDDRGSLLRFMTILPFGWVVGILLGELTWASFGTVQIFYAGLVLMIAGVLLRWWSVATLGRFFTVNVAIRPDHKVVDWGPYRYVRHPAYTAVLLVHVGASLCLANVLSVVALTVPLMVVLVYRMRVEEDVLLAGLGQAYRDYMTRTKRLIPGMY